METMTEKEMQTFANEQEGYEVEFLLEYAQKLGYEASLLNEGTLDEEYLFTKKTIKKSTNS